MIDVPSGTFDYLRDVRLETVYLQPTALLVRLYFSTAAPLAATGRPARFSDPLEPDTAPRRFAGIYVATDFPTAFVETLIRDDGDFKPGAFPLPLTTLKARSVAILVPTSELTLVSLEGEAPTRMRIPTDTVRGKAHALGRRLAEAIWQHSPEIDGIAYPSRFTGRFCAMIYDRALTRLHAASSLPVMDHDELDDVLDSFEIALT